MKLYISHRRGDSDELSERLCGELARRFGSPNIRFENDTIPTGSNFRRYICERVSTADAVLVLIGERWLNDKTPGRRPLLNSLDFIRIELETTFHCKLPCIPVLLSGRSTMPETSDLPASLQALAAETPLVLNDDAGFPANLDRLIHRLESFPKQPRKKPHSPDLLLGPAMRRIGFALALTGLFLTVFFAWRNYYNPAGKNRRTRENTQVNEEDATNVELDQNLITPAHASEP